MDKQLIKSGIIDKNGIEVKIGDTIVLPYVDPMGDISETEGTKAIVVFEHGCFGYYDETHFNPLFIWQRQVKGEYISNEGNRVVYTGEYPFWVVAE